jgi:hypothetical protein
VHGFDFLNDCESRRVAAFCFGDILRIKSRQLAPQDQSWFHIHLSDQSVEAA